MSNKNRKKNDILHGVDRAFAEEFARRTGAIVRENRLPEGKISDILCEYAQPLVEEFVRSDQDHVDVLNLACDLWNTVLIKGTGGKLYNDAEAVMISLLAAPPFTLTPVGALNLIESMTQRREEKFSWCARLIMDKQIIIKGTQLYLSVVTAELPGLGEDAPAEPDCEQET